MALTPQEASAVKAVKAAHDDVVRRAHVVNNQLRDVPHGNVDMGTLSMAIGYEGDAIRTLLDLAQGVQPQVPDPADVDDQAESAREVWQEWHNGR